MRHILTVIILIGLTFGGYKGYELYQKVDEQKEYKEVVAEINKVNYGLFNMEVWKDKAMDIFTQKIEDFQISPQVYKDVEKELSAYLRVMYVEWIASGKLVNQFVDEAQRDGKLNAMFAKLIKDNVGNMIGNMGLESKIPQLSATLSAELKSNEPKLRGYLEQGLKSMLFEEDGTPKLDPRRGIYEHYGYTSLAETNEGLVSKINSLELEIQSGLKLVYLIVLGLAILSLLLYKVIGGVSSISIVSAASIILLLLGVTMPMIDIDARLNAFSMDLVGTEVSFDEQYLYYQSKSILEVTKTLIEGGGFDLKIVGVLILLFSIVVPFIKLVLSTLFLYSKKIRKSNLVKTIIYHLGKWSMADVFVVAMFMAYIGFYGIVTAQLGDIGRNQSGYAVETLNYSRLSPGALFFTTYCVLSIITGILIKRWEGKQDVA